MANVKDAHEQNLNWKRLKKFIIYNKICKQNNVQVLGWINE